MSLLVGGVYSTPQILHPSLGYPTFPLPETTNVDAMHPAGMLSYKDFDLITEIGGFSTLNFELIFCVIEKLVTVVKWQRKMSFDITQCTVSRNALFWDINRRTEIP